MTATDALILLLWALALMRLTRLINADELTDPLRLWIMRRTGPESKWSYFVQCPWCVSMWLGFATAAFPVWLTGVSWWWLPLLALAGSHLTGLLAQLDDSDADIVIED